MSLNLPRAPESYNQPDQATFRRIIEDNDAIVQKKNEDLIIAGARRLVLVAPNGALWSVVVDNSGNLSASAL